MFIVYDTEENYVLEELSMPLFEKRNPDIKRVILHASLTENIKCIAVSHKDESLAICYKGHFIVGAMSDFFK